MNLPSNIAKSSLLATIIFWTIGFTEHYDIDMIPFVFISYIPIFLCCLFTIVSSICPFFWFAERKDINKESVFFTFFPYYSITCFALCVLGIMATSFEVFVIGFFAAVFITTSQSWLWFAKETSK